MSVTYNLVSKAPKDTALILRSCFHTLLQYLCTTWLRHMPEGPPCTHWPCLPFIIVLEVLMNYPSHILVYLEIIWVAACVNRAFHWKPASSQTEGGRACGKAWQRASSKWHPKLFHPLQSQQVAHSTGKSPVQTAATSCSSKTRHSACLFKLSWLLKYTPIILTRGVAMTCFNVPMESCFLLTLSRQTRNR